MSIPIANIYYLLAYAWDSLDESQIINVKTNDFQDSSELLAAVLESGVTHIIKRGLDRSYSPTHTDTQTPRGKILIGPTVKRNLVSKCKVQCSIDRLSPDVLHNRIIRSTLALMAGLEQIPRQHRRRLKTLSDSLSDVSMARITQSDFRQVVVHRNNRMSGFLVNVCQLIHDCVSPKEGNGCLRFKEFERDDRKMAVLFERFVRNFYRREQSVFAVDNPWIEWRDVRATDADLEFLPTMKTDIVLRAAHRVIIIDAKFYRTTLRPTYRSDKERIRSDHLYQLMSYLNNIPATDAATPEGMLVYPTTGCELDLRYEINGKPIRVCTVDLHSDWRAIRDRLNAIIGC